MKCLNCSKKSEVSYPNGDLCKNCFLDILIRRIKKEIRTKNPFRKNEKVLVEGKLAEYFLKKAVENLPLKITVKQKVIGNEKYDKIVVLGTADDEAQLFYEKIMEKNPKFSENSKVIKIFKPILDKELEQAAKILKIHFKAHKKSKEYEKIIKKNPSAAFGLVKSSEDFENS